MQLELRNFYGYPLHKRPVLTIFKLSTLRKTMIERTCQHCAKTYQTFPSIKPKFCSSKCAGAAKKNGEVKRCVVCGTEFYAVPSRRTGLYCSKSCHMTARNLTEANPALHRDISGANNPMFGKAGQVGPANGMFGRRREACPRWTGGRKVRKDGYALIYTEAHPSLPDGQPGYVLEHRLIAEQILGRHLTAEEVVHHVNENPSDNRPENLRVMTQAEHMQIHHSAGK
jgi:hypothetical protein